MNRSVCVGGGRWRVGVCPDGLLTRAACIPVLHPLPTEMGSETLRDPN